MGSLNTERDEMMEWREGRREKEREEWSDGKVSAWDGYGRRRKRRGECEWACASVRRNWGEVRQEGHGMRGVYMEDRGRGEEWIGVKSSVSTFSLHWKVHESERSFIQEGIPSETGFLLVQHCSQLLCVYSESYVKLQFNQKCPVIIYSSSCHFWRISWKQISIMKVNEDWGFQASKCHKKAP